MNKNELAKKIMTYILLAGLVAVIIVYFLVYKSFNDQAAAIRTSNKSLEAHVAELREYYENEPVYLDSIENCQKEIDKMLKTFPADVKEEDVLMLAIDTIKKSEVNYQTINTGTRAALTSIGEDMIVPAGIEEYSTPIIIVERDASYVTQADYKNLKSVIKAINDMSKRSTIKNIVFSNPSTESTTLEGTIDVAFYAALGTGREYEPVNLPEYEAGLEDLFGLEKTKVIEEEVTETDDLDEAE